MATLTADEIEYIRAMSGDDCTPYDVSDGLMQKLFDSVTGNECATIVSVLRVREVKAAKLVNESNAETGDSRSLNQKYQALKELRKDWETRCGMSGGTLEFGSFDLNIDTDCENWLNAEAS